jgi:hypothetical protein
VLQNTPSDRWDIKAIVFAVLLIDTVGTMMACAQVYLVRVILPNASFRALTSKAVMRDQLG